MDLDSDNDFVFQSSTTDEDLLDEWMKFLLSSISFFIVSMFVGRSLDFLFNFA